MSAIARISNLFSGFFSLFVSRLERNNPEALLALEKENLRKLIAQYNEGLAAHAGLSERLMHQVRKLEQEKEELEAQRADPSYEPPGPVAPCGLCRQTLLEYEVLAGRPIRLLMLGMDGSVLEAKSVRSLLPHAFTPEDLKRD